MSETSTSLSMTETDSDKIIVYIHGMGGGDDVLETTVQLTSNSFQTRHSRLTHGIGPRPLFLR